jgi:hypothetical protein
MSPKVLSARILSPDAFYGQFSLLELTIIFYSHYYESQRSYDSVFITAFFQSSCIDSFHTFR